MDRQIIYPGQIPLETDLLNTNRNTMVALGKLAGAIFGTSTPIVNGLTVAPSTPASLSVSVAAGEIYSLENVDNTAYSSLAADTTDTVVKQGIALASTSLACAAPTTAGFSINYLIEATFAEVDGGATVLPYYNASNPTQAYSGPNNAGTSQATTRAGQVQLQAKPGVAATTGSQVTPTVDAGYVALAVVTVANGQTTIVTGDITAVTTSVLPSSLLQAIQDQSPGRLLNIQQFSASGTYTPTTGVRQIRVVVVGGGGGGGGCAASGSSAAAAAGGGASGTYFESALFDVPSDPVSVTIGAGGAGGSAGENYGYSGGASSFGSLISCPGGAYGGAGVAGYVTIPGGSQVSPPTATVTPVISSPGGFGTHGLALITSAGNLIIGGSGGSTPYGNGAGWPEVVGAGKSVLSSSANAGGGGGGAISNNSAAAAGGAGAPGAVYVYEYS